jgi:formate/nitrite transporter FocA (FNT family)
MITGVIGFGGFHHSIVGNIEVFGAFLHTNTITILDYLVFLSLAIVGNAIGGAVVVGLFKYRIFESNNMK